jgi:hypothetical protein
MRITFALQKLTRTETFLSASVSEDELREVLQNLCTRHIIESIKRPLEQFSMLNLYILYSNEL